MNWFSNACIILSLQAEKTRYSWFLFFLFSTVAADVSLTSTHYKFNSKCKYFATRLQCSRAGAKLIWVHLPWSTSTLPEALVQFLSLFDNRKYWKCVRSTNKVVLPLCQYSTWCVKYLSLNGQIWNYYIQW
jgi:hypothetical protein